MEEAAEQEAEVVEEAAEEEPAEEEPAEEEEHQNQFQTCQTTSMHQPSVSVTIDV